MKNAAVVWIREETLRTKDGQERWTAWLEWLNTPPGAATPTAAVPASPAPSKAQAMLEQARAAVGNEGAAFAAFVASQ